MCDGRHASALTRISGRSWSTRASLPKRAIKWRGRYRRFTVLRFARMHVRPLNRNNHLADYRPSSVYRVVQERGRVDQLMIDGSPPVRAVPNQFATGFAAPFDFFEALLFLGHRE